MYHMKTPSVANCAATRARIIFCPRRGSCRWKDLIPDAKKYAVAAQPIGTKGWLRNFVFWFLFWVGINIQRKAWSIEIDVYEK